MCIAYRNVLSLVARDRIFTLDIEEGAALLQSWSSQ